jgi:hypothetical protein
MVVMTMCSAERNLVDNLILLGFVPGPTKVADIRVYLQPFIEDLKRGHGGVSVAHAGEDGDDCVIRLALVGAMVDLPAVSELGGFRGHGALNGCNMCTGLGKYKTFGSSNGGKTVWPVGDVGADISASDQRSAGRQADEIWARVVEGEHGALAEYTRFITGLGVKHECVFLELDELYMEAYGVGFNPSVDMWIDSMHLCNTIATKEMNSISKHGLYDKRKKEANIDLATLDNRVSRLANEGYFPRGRHNRRPYKPSTPEWGMMTRIRFIKESAVAIYAGLIEPQAMASLAALQHVFRLMLRNKVPRADISRLSDAIRRWRVLHHKAYGDVNATITQHRLEHVPQQMLRTGSLQGVGCHTGERKNGVYKKRTPVTNGRNVDRQYAKLDATIRSVEHSRDYQHERKHQDIRDSRVIGPYSPCFSGRRMAIDEVYPELADEHGDQMVCKVLQSLVDTPMGGAVQNIRGYGVVTCYDRYRSATENYARTHNVEASGSVVLGDVVRVCAPDGEKCAWAASHGPFGYARIEKIIRFELVVVTSHSFDDSEHRRERSLVLDVIDGAWLHCLDKRGEGGQLMVTPHQYPLDQRLFNATWLSGKCYLMPEWGTRVSPEKNSVRAVADSSGRSSQRRSRPRVSYLEIESADETEDDSDSDVGGDKFFLIETCDSQHNNDVPALQQQ